MDVVFELLRDGRAAAALGTNHAIRITSNAIQHTLNYQPASLATMMNKLAVVLAAVLPLATADGPPSLPAISSWTYAGSGCRGDSNVVKTGSGWGDLGFEFPDTLKATSGSPGSSTKNCLISLQGTGAPAGWQVAVESVPISGHATVQPGDKVEYLLTSNWAGEQPTGQARDGTTNTGDALLDSDVSYVATIPADGLAWSKCFTSSGDTGILTINLRTITTMSKTGDSHSFAADKINFAWRQC